MITGLFKPWCQVSDMNRAIAFYRDVLGLRSKFASPYWSEFDAGNGVTIALHHQLDPSKPLVGGGGWVLGVQTDDIRALRAKVESGGGSVVGEYHDTPSGVVLTMADLDGNQIQAIQVGKMAADL
ncbi:MAG: VOC family protein [Fimbriimonadaceae bacterium]